MSQLRLITLSLLAASSALTFAGTDSSVLSTSSTPTLLAPQASTVIGAAADALGRPTLGLRVGAGNWNQLTLNLGADVTFKVPILPLPALRIDAEAWATPSDFSSLHGNAVSLLGLQTFLLGYVGAGPSYYFTDDHGYHKSGFGAKILGGLNLPDSAFVEAGLILGASPTPIVIAVGKRF